MNVKAWMATVPACISAALGIAAWTAADANALAVCAMISDGD
jgi:hypothetical protein